MKNERSRQKTQKIMKEKESALIHGKDGDIAIIGMAGRFPGAANYGQFWENIKHGRSCIKEIPQERWDWKAYWGNPYTEKNKTNVKWGGFIENISSFDLDFFGLTIREVETMDPQQRIMLELTWSCFEDAAICPSHFAGKKIGVFIGVANLDYKELQEEYHSIETHYATGIASSVIASRISYYYNFMGPSFSIDTACASSLNAIHSAIQSIRQGECIMALAGGVSLLLTPLRYISFAKMGILSPTGSCKTFDENADGVVRGEGAGLILLKPLEKAMQDRNPIHGILKGSAINHSGRTYTLSYPNPEAQAEVITEALKKAMVSPASISYIETHGTGTPKGDPIEFKGLCSAFRKFDNSDGQKPSTNHCGLGSVKTNIGHLEAAAGISSVIKVLLSMKHKQLTGLQNFCNLNHRISLKNSPFYIVDQLKIWEPLADENKRNTVRRAGVSAFGFAGTNAHVILEEAHVPAKSVDEKYPYYLICLSAKTVQALQGRERSLVHWINKQKKYINLADISATLLLGREHFCIRSAYVVRDIQDLKHKLKKVRVNNQIKGCFKNSCTEKSIQSITSLKVQTYLRKLSTHEERNEQKYGEKLITLAKLYAKGYNFEWKYLYPDGKAARLNLPTYPFTRKDVWLPEIDKPYQRSKILVGAAPHHPLVHHNISDSYTQRFSTSFRGDEFFLEDHIVNGKRILPGVVYLEMVREAVEQAINIREKRKKRIRIENIIWSKPLVVKDQPVIVHIRLFPLNSGKIGYEIYSEKTEVNKDVVVYCQGRAVLTSVDKVPDLNLNALKAQCVGKTFTSDQCYEFFKKIGIEYGPGHRGLEIVNVGSTQILAKLFLPSAVLDTQNQFVLHPSLLDSALQASLLMSSSDEKPALPFALHKIEIFSKCTTVMWALIRNSDDSSESKLKRMDIDICDGQGTICVRMKGFCPKTPASMVDLTGPVETIGTLLFKPYWNEQIISQQVNDSQYSQHIVVFCELSNASLNDSEIQKNRIRSLVLQSTKQSIAERFIDYAAITLKNIQNIIKEKHSGKILLQIVIHAQKEQALLAGLSGLLKSAQLEYPKLTGQLIEVEHCDDIVNKLKENKRFVFDNQIRYRDGKRYAAYWRVIEVSEAAMKIPWKDRGVYLITGGAGGLGNIFSGEIVKQVKSANLVLIGRSVLNEQKQNQIKKLKASGARIIYEQTDVNQKQAVDELIQKIYKEFGSINGIIHSAGVIRDNFILNKSKEELQEVLSVKINGLVNLDEATKELPLDFFISFSSGAAAIGNPGQADYAAANAFMDCYAEYRNSLVRTNQRHGHTLSINWPLWKNGGMQVDEATTKRMRQSNGMKAIDSDDGIKAFYQCISSGMDRVMVMKGELGKIKQKLLSPTVHEAEKPKSDITISETIRTDDSNLVEKVLKILIQTVSELLKVETRYIDVDSELGEFGLDSIALTEFINKLNEEYQLELSPTLFFEHSTLNKLAHYLMKEYQNVFASKFAVPAGTAIAEQVIENKFQKKERLHERSSGSTGTEDLTEARPIPISPEPIAIVGMSGIFPMAKDINEFWKNLENGRDCITEIPQDRWDWQEYYGEPNEKANKTKIKWGGFIDGVYEFDPSFFGISPKEAKLMDPQQRLLMTYIWKAIEDAGYSAQSLWGTNSSIFVGTANSGYSTLISKANIATEGYSFTGMVPSIGPNRMSYYLNLHGPSEPIETACSSSLVAVHRAVCAIENDVCELAIAGGVNVIVTPEAHISFNKAGMLSEDGRCKTFSSQANGYVRGEGVGMLVLKKLKAAEEAGDHIYGVILGTAENHGGRVNSLTAPNPKAQAELLQAAYTKARIDPRTVSYIEVHGTGTQLGDPIEINGLKAAFKELYRATGNSRVAGAHCALGSVKSNIGHLELAAGIAGLIKVLLQLKHKILVKSLHCEEINPYIQLQDSPFFIVQENKEWAPLQDPQGKKIPRRAGVSSFGFGGVNAHVVLEEYIPKDLKRPQIRITSQNPAIIVLSAKNEERLKEQARLLLSSIKERQFPDASMAEMAYTLQVGREPMEERLALIVNSFKELEEKLKGFLEDRESIELYRGQVKRNKETLAVLAADEDMAKTIDAWIIKKKYAKLLDLWAKGLVFDWNKLYGDAKPQRISLLTYPFARECYCVPANDSKYTGGPVATSAVISAIHPLLQQNTSDFSEQRFSSTFTGKEFFLADHVVKGQRVLPGVAYLEMARAAVEQATGVLAEGRIGIRLKNVVWLRPIVVKAHPVKIHIALFPDNNGDIAYEIYSECKESDIEQTLHSQGSAVLATATKTTALDLPALRELCCQSVLSPDQCYEAFKAAGINYGPSHQGIETVYVGTRHVLAKLSLPASIKETKNTFALHPSLMDAAFQAVIGLIKSTNDIEPLDSKILLKPALPFALQEIEVLSKCTPSMWALLRYSDNGNTNDKLQNLDIELCDDQKNVCVRIKGLSVRVLENELNAASWSETAGTLMLEPFWQEHAVGPQVLDTVFERHLVMLCEPNAVLLESIETQMNEVRCLPLQSGHRSIEERYQDYVVKVFSQIQSILKDKIFGKMLIQIVVPNKGEQQLFCGLAGLLKTAKLENPNLFGQLIEMEPDEEPDRTICKLQENGCNPLDSCVRYQDGKRYVAGWREFEPLQVPTNFPWKNEGVYLITGGVGGLGFIFAKEIARQVQGATLILTGRSPLNAAKQLRIKELKALNVRVEFRQIDVSEKLEVDRLIQSIQQNFGSFNGIIHSAGVVRNDFIIKKNEKDLQDVLTPKVTGLVNLDQATKEWPLDFFILFSSVAGALGNIGQADYAAGNAFMDVYAGYRNALVISKRRYGQTISINWPLWQEGGMHVDPETEKMLKQKIGMTAMQTTTGIRSLYQSLASGKNQVMVLEGDPKRLQKVLLEQPESENAPSGSEADKPAPAIATNMLQDKAVSYLKNILSSIIEMPAHRIDADAPLDKYGVNSIIGMQLISQLERTFGALSKTLIFEYQNIYDLAKYFQENYQQQLKELLGIAEKSTVNAEHPEVPSIVTESGYLVANSRRRSRFLIPRGQSCKKKGTSDIAIIGISGRYPQAETIQEFWKNLKDSKDCIEEIPENRWDHKAYFDEDRNKPGKTYSKWGGFIAGVDLFDPLFFNISPRQAEIMDPMIRLFLETVWNLLENTGYTRETIQRLYQGKVGMYVGAMYQQYHYVAADIVSESAISVSSFSSITNRVSHFFNFQGPSVAIDTMCSSSAMSIHMACESLIKGDSKIAIAGGVNLSIHPEKYLGLSSGQMLGSHIKSRSFGDGDGYIPAEGVGAVLLKPLAKAIEDQDTILAVIKSTGTNHNGHTNGFAVPNPNTQAKLMEDSFMACGIDPRTISYVEAAANGSAIGDPIEIAALNKAFRKFTNEKQFCAIGSVKSNIGHAEAASGISQLTKVILQLQNQQIVPSINTDPLNPNISFADSPFYLQRELQEWKRPVIQINGEKKEFPRRAAINSFGAGGSNVHLIVEEYISTQKETVSDSAANAPQIVVFSARNKNRLSAVIQQMLTYIEAQNTLFLPDIAYTLQTGREAMEARMALVVNKKADLIAGLKDYLNLDRKNKVIEPAIPIFTSDLSEDHIGARELNSDNGGDSIVQTLIAEKNLIKLARYWTQGGKIPWESLYLGQKVRKISLPTYPFARERYWVTVKEPVRLKPEIKASMEDFAYNQSANINILSDQEKITNHIVQFLSRELNIARDKIKLHKNIRDYGGDSIIALKLMRDIEKCFKIKITTRKMLEHRTIKHLSGYIAAKIRKTTNTEKSALVTKPLKISEPVRPKPKIETLVDGAIQVETVKAELPLIETEVSKFDEFIDNKLIEILEELTEGTITLKDAQKIIK